MPYATADDGAELYYEVHGSGPAFFMSQHWYASPVPMAMSKKHKAQYLSYFTDAYSVIMWDPRGMGRTKKANDGEAGSLGIGGIRRITADHLAVVDAAGFDTFAYTGYSWGGSTGIRMALETDRISALMIGGWPVLGAPWKTLLDTVTGNGKRGFEAGQKKPGRWAGAIEFYAESLAWDEREHLSAITCPRMNYVAENDESQMPWGLGRLMGITPVPLAQPLRDHEQTLITDGWEIRWLPPEGHGIVRKPELVAPVLRAFLDQHRDQLG